MCIRVCAQVQFCVRAGGGGRRPEDKDNYGCHFHKCLLSPLSQGLTSLELTEYARLTGQQVPGILLPLLSQHWDYRCDYRHGPPHQAVGAGDDTRVPMFKRFMDGVFSPQALFFESWSCGVSQGGREPMILLSWPPPL